MIDKTELISRLRPLPRELSTLDPAISHLASFSDHLSTNPPRWVTAIVAVPWDKRLGRDRWSRLLSIGRFSTPFAAISEVARALAPAVSSTGLVPTIQPIHERALELSDFEDRFLRRLLADNYLIFAAKEGQQ